MYFRQDVFILLEDKESSCYFLDKGDKGEAALSHVRAGDGRKGRVGRREDPKGMGSDDIAAERKQKESTDDGAEEGLGSRSDLKSDEGRESEGEGSLSDSLSLSLSAVRREYPGFSSLGPDLYISSLDPCLQVLCVTPAPQLLLSLPSVFVFKR